MQDIHDLIRRYFDGTTTGADERKLRDMLLSGRYSGDDVDEALVVMGYWAMKRGAQMHHTRRHQRRSRAAWAAAACVGVVISVGAWMMYGVADSGRSECVAYINGVEYTGDRATDIMHDQLGMLSLASESVEESISADLSAFSDFIE